VNAYKKQVAHRRITSSRPLFFSSEEHRM